MHHTLSTDGGPASLSTRILPPAKPPASVVDDGRVRIGAGLGKPAVTRA